jgi:hypothetical protein
VPTKREWWSRSCHRWPPVDAQVFGGRRGSNSLVVRPTEAVPGKQGLSVWLGSRHHVQLSVDVRQLSSFLVSLKG